MSALSKAACAMGVGKKAHVILLDIPDCLKLLEFCNVKNVVYSGMCMF